MAKTSNQSKPKEPKVAPRHVSGKNVSDTKKKTEPLKGNAITKGDQEEGRMQNGELGDGMKQEA